MLEFRYDTQLLIEGENLDEDKINEYFTNNFKGDCLLAVGDEELIKIHFHTNEPWKWFISIAKRPFRVIQIDCKNSRSSVDLIMFCFDFRYYFICIPVLIYNNL